MLSKQAVLNTWNIWFKYHPNARRNRIVMLIVVMILLTVVIFPVLIALAPYILKMAVIMLGVTGFILFAFLVIQVLPAFLLGFGVVFVLEAALEILFPGFAQRLYGIFVPFVGGAAEALIPWSGWSGDTEGIRSLFGIAVSIAILVKWNLGSLEKALIQRFAYRQK